MGIACTNVLYKHDNDAIVIISEWITRLYCNETAGMISTGLFYIDGGYNYEFINPGFLSGRGWVFPRCHCLCCENLPC
jgi:hypothetical protein